MTFPFWFIILALSDTAMHACAHLPLGTETISLVLLPAVLPLHTAMLERKTF